MQLRVRSRSLFAGVLAGFGLVALAQVPAVAQTGEAAPTQIVVSGGNRSLFKIALPKLIGDDGASATVGRGDRDA